MTNLTTPSGGTSLAKTRETQHSSGLSSLYLFSAFYLANPGLVEFNKDLQATVSVSTAFERIAVYACQQVARAEPIDSAFVEMIKSNPIFQTHYTLDIVSPHKVLSVLRFWSLGSDANGNPTPFPDSYEKMALVQRAQIAKGSYRQVVAFPYRDELGGGECFEIAVQKLLFLSGTMVRFRVFLNKYH